MDSTGGEKPKYTIKQVMQQAHRKGLLKEVLSGSADEGKKKELLAMYVALSQNKPPSGSAEDWKKRTGAIVAAAKAVAAGKDEATKRLAKATNCKACHDEHK